MDGFFAARAHVEECARCALPSHLCDARRGTTGTSPVRQRGIKGENTETDKKGGRGETIVVRRGEACQQSRILDEGARLWRTHGKAPDQLRSVTEPP